MIKSISINEFINGNFENIIDIRDKQRYNEGHIPNSKNISFNDLMINFKRYLNKSDIYYIYCQRGIQSQKVCQILSINGYNVVNIQGGYNSWIKEHN